MSQWNERTIHDILSAAIDKPNSTQFTLNQSPLKQARFHYDGGCLNASMICSWTVSTSLQQLINISCQIWSVKTIRGYFPVCLSNHLSLIYFFVQWCFSSCMRCILILRCYCPKIIVEMPYGRLQFWIFFVHGMTQKLCKGFNLKFCACIVFSITELTCFHVSSYISGNTNDNKSSQWLPNTPFASISECLVS